MSSSKKDIKSTSEAVAQSITTNAAQPIPTTSLSLCDDQIIFGIADIKYCEGKVKTLEWGDGFVSGIKDVEQVMKDCENFLTKFGLPLLTKDEIRTKLDLSEKPKSTPSKLSNYRCILKRGHKKPFENFQGAPVFMLSNSPFWELLTQHKNILFELFKRAGCENAVPLTRIYHQSIFSVHEREKLADAIQKDFPGIEMLVLKAPHSSDGFGVFVVKASDLENTLPILLDGKNKEEFETIVSRYRLVFASKKTAAEIDQDITQATLWRAETMRLPEFLVQAYCPSDNVDISGKKYDATLRVTFLMILNEGKLKFHPLSSYWKVPVSPIDGTALRDKTISNVHKGIGRYPTDKKVEVEVFKQLEPVMIAVFKEMFTANPRTYIESLIHSEDKRRKLRGVIMALQYAKGLNTLHLYSEVFEILKMIRTDIKSLNIINCATLYSKILAEAQLYSEYYLEAEKTLTEALKLTDTSKAVTDEICAEMYLFRSFIFSLQKDISKEKADRERANSYYDKNALKTLSEKIAYISFGNKFQYSKSKAIASNASLTEAQTGLLRLGQNRNDVVVKTSQQITYNPKQIAAVMKTRGFDSQKLEMLHYTPAFHFENKSPYGFIRKITVDGNILTIYFHDFSSRYIQSMVLSDEEYGGLPLDEKAMAEYHQNALEIQEPHHHLWFKEPINVKLLKRFMTSLNVHERIFMNTAIVDGTRWLSELHKKELMSGSMTATMDLKKIPKSVFCFAQPEYVTNDHLANICWLPAAQRETCLGDFVRYMGQQSDDVVVTEDGQVVGSATALQRYNSAMTTAYKDHTKSAVNSNSINSTHSMPAMHKRIIMAAMKGDVNTLQTLVPDFIREHDINMYYQDTSKKGVNDIQNWGTVMHMAAIAGKTQVLLYLEFELEGKTGDVSKKTNLPDGKTALQYLEEKHPKVFSEYQKQRLERIEKRKKLTSITAHS